MMFRRTFIQMLAAITGVGIPAISTAHRKLLPPPKPKAPVCSETQRLRDLLEKTRDELRISELKESDLSHYVGMFIETHTGQGHMPDNYKSWAERNVKGFVADKNDRWEKRHEWMIKQIQNHPTIRNRQRHKHPLKDHTSVWEYKDLPQYGFGFNCCKNCG